MTRRIAFAGTVAALAATVFLLGGALSGATEAEPAALPAPELAPVRRSPQVVPSTVRSLQADVHAAPQDVEALTALGLAYQQRSRETGDPQYLAMSEGVLRRALALAPRSAEATAGLGSLALARHRFHDALGLGRRALALQPRSGTAWGIIGDALVELGRYRKAFSAFDRMVQLDPGLASYARISYARELLGRPRAAIEPMRAAVDASGYRGEPFAWTSVQLGKLHWSLGHVRAAERQYRLALALFPGYVYALDALAHVEAARGRLERAIALERRAVEKVPLPQFVAALGDLYRATGRSAQAQEQYELIGAMARLLAASGVKTDLEIALFNADHGIRLPETLVAARRAHRERPSVEADDALAWTLERNGRCGEALRYSKRALRLGTLDALKYFHRGMIERCLGRDAHARRWMRRALALNPHFSLIWAPAARRVVAS